MLHLLPAIEDVFGKIKLHSSAVKKYRGMKAAIIRLR